MEVSEIIFGTYDYLALKILTLKHGNGAKMENRLVPFL